MKKIILFTIYICMCTASHAEDSIGKKRYNMVTELNTIHLASVTLIDEYLSSLPYKGFVLQYENNRFRYLTQKTDKISQQSKIRLSLGTTLNPTNSTMIAYVALDYGYGVHYHFRPHRRLQLLVGSVLNFELGAKYQLRNVNMPLSVDLAGNMNFSFILQHAIRAKKQELLFQAAIRIPVIGCMFVPEQGASYYEIFYMKNRTNTAHFSSIFYNKYGINQTYTLEIPAGRSVWCVGITWDYVKYQANDLVFKRNMAGVLLGWRHHIISFAGKKNTAPVDFYTPYLQLDEDTKARKGK